MISAMFNAPGMESPTNILRTVRIFLTRISSNSFQTKPGIGDTQKKILCIYLYTLFVAVCMPYVCIVYIYIYIYIYTLYVYTLDNVLRRQSVCGGFAVQCIFKRVFLAALVRLGVIFHRGIPFLAVIR